MAVRTVTTCASSSVGTEWQHKQTSISNSLSTFQPVRVQHVCVEVTLTGTQRLQPSLANRCALLFFFQIFDTELKDQEREVCFIDIAYDEIPERYYKESEVSLCRCVEMLTAADSQRHWRGVSVALEAGNNSITT